MTSTSPFALSQHLGDVEILASSRLLCEVPLKDLRFVTDVLEHTLFPAGAKVSTKGDYLAGPLFLLEGEARSDADPAPLVPGAVIGGRTLNGPLTAPADVVAVTKVRTALLPRARLEIVRRNHPEVAAVILRAAALERGPAPTAAERPADVEVGSLVPSHVDGALVVGARSRNRTVALSSRVDGPAGLEPLTTRVWEGREIYKRSASLVFLEAAHRLGRHDLRLGASWTSGRVVSALDPIGDAPALAIALDRKIGELIAADIPLREETWDIDRAIDHFAGLGWRDVTELLASSTESTVRLVSCGELCLPRPGVMLHRTGMLHDIHVGLHPDGLALDFGPTVRRELARRQVSTVYLETSSPRYGGEMTKAERRWLEALGITSVGSLNRAVVTGEARELVSVAEGFQEKRLATLADEIRDRGTIRVIAVAGPSSSGKTTFLKRLRVQLEVDGIVPIGISLDDYYVDRERTVRDADGEYDYEAYEAIDGQLLATHLDALLEGKRVRTARYDFTTGKSHPDGGPEIALGPNALLVLEGIHALNPALLVDRQASEVFRIFIHPATALPFDPLTIFEPADVRLLRRIVRDRHERGATAEANLARWSSVRRGERIHIYPHQGVADRVFDTSLLYEVNVLKVFAERYLLEVPRSSREYPAALRLRHLLAPFVTISPEHVPPTSILREFIGGQTFRW
ncbi:MAG: cyclic nucleotide-binding protein [Myxococcales bacterium]|nr:cyclic nucleotide-binding protein [Myxococcales bacterium]